MDDLGLENTGITDYETVYHNLSYDELFQHEIDPSLEGYEKGVVTTSGAVAVDTGKFTGRSPKAKYFVEDDASRDTVWWAGPERKGSDNKPISQGTWNHLKGIAVGQLNGKKLYVVDVLPARTRTRACASGSSAK